MEIRVGGRGICFRRKALFSLIKSHCSIITVFFSFFLRFKYYFNDRLRKCLLNITIYCYKTKCNKFRFFFWRLTDSRSHLGT